ncbi:MAG: hypothetical protein ACK4HV_06870, partial [Parachlamydiaceae bacterium]
KVALKRFFFFDNSRNAYRALARREVKEIDRDKLQGEIKLAKLRRFEQVWRKYGKACVQNKNDETVKTIVSKLQNLRNEIGDIHEIKSIVELKEKDLAAFRLLDTAVTLLDEDKNKEESRNKRKVDCYEKISEFSKIIKNLESKLSVQVTDLKSMDIRDLDFVDSSVLKEIDEVINHYEKTLSDNLDVLTKEVEVKFKHFIDESKKRLENQRTFFEELKRKKEELKLQKALSEYHLAQNALSAVTIELQNKIIERKFWDPPQKYAKLTLQELKEYVVVIEKKLQEYEKLDRFQMNSDYQDLRNDLLTIKDYISENRILLRSELDREIEHLEKRREILFEEKKKFENEYYRQKSLFI